MPFDHISGSWSEITAYIEAVVVGLLIWRDEGICECPCFFEDLDPGHVTVQVWSIGISLGSIIEAVD